MKIKPHINALARLFYKHLGYEVPEGFDFEVSRHPTEKGMFQMAEAAWEFFYGDRPDYSDDEGEEEGPLQPPDADIEKLAAVEAAWHKFRSHKDLSFMSGAPAELIETLRQVFSSTSGRRIVDAAPLLTSMAETESAETAGTTGPGETPEPA